LSSGNRRRDKKQGYNLLCLDRSRRKGWSILTTRRHHPPRK
jgi:hypothetical protein